MYLYKKNIIFKVGYCHECAFMRKQREPGWDENKFVKNIFVLVCFVNMRGGVGSTGPLHFTNRQRAIFVL